MSPTLPLSAKSLFLLAPYYILLNGLPGFSLCIPSSHLFPYSLHSDHRGPFHARSHDVADMLMACKHSSVSEKTKPETHILPMATGLYNQHFAPCPWGYWVSTTVSSLLTWYHIKHLTYSGLFSTCHFLLKCYFPSLYVFTSFSFLLKYFCCYWVFFWVIFPSTLLYYFP